MTTSGSWHFSPDIKNGELEGIRDFNVIFMVKEAAMMVPGVDQPAWGDILAKVHWELLQREWSSWVRLKVHLAQDPISDWRPKQLPRGDCMDSAASVGSSDCSPNLQPFVTQNVILNQLCSPWSGSMSRTKDMTVLCGSEDLMHKYQNTAGNKFCISCCSWQDFPLNF